MILDSRNEVESAARAAGVTVKDCRTPGERQATQYGMVVAGRHGAGHCHDCVADVDGGVTAVTVC